MLPLLEVQCHTNFQRPDAERKKFKDDLPRLKETRAIARRQVREAKKKRRRRPSDPHAPRASRSDDDRSSTSDDSRHVYYDEDDLESLFEGWKAEEEEKKVYAKAEREFLQEEAVKAWKEQQLHEAKARQQRIDNERSSLRTELKQQNLAPQQIEDIVNHIHPHDMKSDAHILNRAIASDNASSTTTNDTPAKPTLSKSCRGSKWLKKFVLEIVRCYQISAKISQEIDLQSPLIRRSHNYQRITGNTCPRDSQGSDRGRRDCTVGSSLLPALWTCTRRHL